MDAFTSDSIPTHLLTEEAFRMYFDRLAPGGLVAVNISNRYFALWHTVANTVAPLGIDTMLRLGNTTPRPEDHSLWLVLARRGEMPKEFSKRGWKPIPADDTAKPWTDDYSSLLNAMTLSVGKQVPK